MSCKSTGLQSRWALPFAYRHGRPLLPQFISPRVRTPSRVRCTRGEEASANSLRAAQWRVGIGAEAVLTLRMRVAILAYAGNAAGQQCITVLRRGRYTSSGRDAAV